MIDVVANQGSDNRIFTVGNTNQLSEKTVGVKILNLENAGAGLEPHYLYRLPEPHDNGILVENAQRFSDAGAVEPTDGFCAVDIITPSRPYDPYSTHEIWKCHGVSGAGFAAVVDPKTGRKHFLPPMEPSSRPSNRTYEIFGEAPRTVSAQGFWLCAGGPQGYVDLNYSEVDLSPSFIEKGGKIWEALERANREASGQH